MDITYHAYLEDESKMVGSADSISFPESEAEICEILQVMRDSQTPVTIQGGKTGIVGSGVPSGGHIMNLSRMNRVKSFYTTQAGETFLRVQPGITLNELRQEIARLETSQALFWPPDPSESTASVGGIAATDATGICHQLYGKSSSYVSGIRIISADGSVHDFTKGQDIIAIGGESKHLMDVYLGGEGMYGVITELTLRLIPKPRALWGIGFFFTDPGDGMSFADHLKSAIFNEPVAKIAAIEYLDPTIIQTLEMQKSSMTRLRQIPDLAPGISAMVYVEIHADREAAIEDMAESLMLIGERYNGEPDLTWAFAGELEIEKMRNFLHAAAETVILQIEKVRCEDSRITKLGIDVSIKEQGLRATVSQFEKERHKQELKTAYSGHVGADSLRIDILPENYEEFVKGRVLLETWAEKYSASIGAAITSYGIGKLKKSIFRKTVSIATIDHIIQLKKQLDKNNFWNPGNMI
jgi:D-lactate dehydrogenase (cytochrome)